MLSACLSCIGLVVGLAAGHVRAAPSAPADLNWLANASSAVVIGTQTASVVSPEGLRLTITVSRSLAGVLVPGSQASVLWAGGIAGPGPSTPALWFLAGDASGWSLLPAQAGAAVLLDTILAVPPGDLPAEYGYAEADPLIDKIVNELRYAAEGNDALARPAISALMTLRSPSAATPSRHATLYGPVHFAECPMGQLLSSLDALVVTRALPQLAYGVPDWLASQVCDVSDPGLVPSLAEILQSTTAGPLANRCAAHALSHAHSSEALPSLRALLGSSDPDLRYVGMVGLALNANNYLPGPEHRDGPYPGGAATPATLSHFVSREAFMTAQKEHLSFWKGWFPNQAPMVSVAGGGASCHPSAPWSPCRLPLSATASDINGDPLYFKWSTCDPALASATQCPVRALGPNTLTVEVSDGRGGTTSQSVVLSGVNQSPTVSSFSWDPRGPLAVGAEATLAFDVSDDDTVPASASCRLRRVIRNCTLVSFECEGTGGFVTVLITGQGGSGLCSVEVEWTDKWGSRVIELMSVDTY